MDNARFSLLLLQDVPIYEQLCIEEALLRTDTGNWCVWNQGSSPAIVLGISGKPEKLVNMERWKKNPLPLIRRFSGGGTVVVDAQTLFITFLGNKDLLPIPCFPQPLMRWTKETFYKALFPFADFALRENDFVFASHKFGGNAQYIQKDRWLQHTTFLWDYDPQQMQLLQLPERRPQYRGTRSHEEFLCRLQTRFHSPLQIQEALRNVLEKDFTLTVVFQEEIEEILERPHRRATQFFPIENAAC